MGIFFSGAPHLPMPPPPPIKYNKALLRVSKNHRLLVFWPNIECIESKIIKLNKSNQGRIWQEHWESNNITLNKLKKLNHSKACRIYEGPNQYEKLEDPDMFGIYEGTNISKFPTLKKKTQVSHLDLHINWSNQNNRRILMILIPFQILFISGNGLKLGNTH